MRSVTIKALLIAAPCLGLAFLLSGCGTSPTAQPEQTSAVETITNSIGMTLNRIPAGEFVMGSKFSPEESIRRFGLEGKNFPDKGEPYVDEQPQHPVRISRAFFMGKTEVTRGQFAEFVRESGHEFDSESAWAYRPDGEFYMTEGITWTNPGFEQDDSHPVVCVNRRDALAFCRWLSEKEGKTYRLPTAAEWEYSCRAGTQTAYQWGDSPDDGAGWANAADLTAKKTYPKMTIFNWDDGYVHTAPVGQFKANAFGLYDMHGNVAEWCSDWNGEFYYRSSPAVDPPGADSAPEHSMRGGSWFHLPVRVRSADRGSELESERSTNDGFRVVLQVAD